MASICESCALAIWRSARHETRDTTRRAFSGSSKTLRSLPTFIESSNAQLNDVLGTLRQKHFIPAALRTTERKLIFAQKSKQSLADNPRSVTIAGETVPLVWMDRRREIPNRRQLVFNATDLIAAGKPQDWQNIPILLTALKEICKKPADHALKRKLLQEATRTGHLDVILKCLQQADRTGLSLRDEQILRYMLAGIRDIAQRGAWSQNSLQAALKAVNLVGQLLEMDDHGSGRILRENDPRVRPEVLGLHLELVAAYASKFEGGLDKEGIIKTHTERLLDSLEGHSPENVVVLENGPQWSFKLFLPVWNGLRIAQQLLQSKMPQAKRADSVIEQYGARLKELAAQLEAKDSANAIHEKQALTLWSTLPGN